ncbi:MAG: hypothetical protein ACFFE8_17085 [Candidatus Heimdallarchaeota archaeon]
MSSPNLKDKVNTSLVILESEKGKVQTNSNLARYAFEQYREELRSAIAADLSNEMKSQFGQKYNEWLRNYERLERQLKEYDQAIFRLKQMSDLSEIKLKAVEQDVNRIYNWVTRLEQIMKDHEREMSRIQQKLEQEQKKGESRDQTIADLLKQQKKMFRELRYMGIGGKVRKGFSKLGDLLRGQDDN